VHPAFADKHDAEHMPRLNAGPVIKQNVNNRYSTEGETAAKFLLLAERVGAPTQWYVHRADMACGSTVGPILASRLGVCSVDVGNAMLSMHSAREMCGTADHPWMIDILTEFLSGTAL
jgi:aspartyl aminopeptidase